MLIKKFFFLKVSAEFAAKSSAIDHNRAEQACPGEVQPRSEAAVALLLGRQLDGRRGQLRQSRAQHHTRSTNTNHLN